MSNKNQRFLQIVIQSYVHNTQGYSRSVIEAIKEIYSRYNQRKKLIAGSKVHIIKILKIYSI